MQHPELPEVNPNELAELRTLQQIVDHLSATAAYLRINGAGLPPPRQRLWPQQVTAAPVAAVPTADVSM